MQISLPSELEKFIEEQVKTGHYATVDAVVENALETLRIQQAGLPAGEELRRLIAEGQAAADRGELIPGPQVFREIREHISKRRAAE